METALGILLFVMIVGSVWCIAQQFRKRRNGTNASGVVVVVVVVARMVAEPRNSDAG